MILEETINKLLRDVVDLLLSSPGYTIKAKQNGAPRPTGSYADVDFVTDSSQGWEQREYQNNQADADLTETIKGMRQIVMSVNFYRDGSVDNARSVRTGLIRESIQGLFRQAGLGLTSRSEIRELSEALEDTWEERSGFDVTLSAVGTDSDIVRSVEIVDIAGEFQSRGLSYNFNIEVQ